MKKKSSLGILYIYLTLIIGLVLESTHWSNDIAVFKPHWLFLIFTYWVLALPHRVNVLSGLFFGCFLDLLLDYPLGTNGFIFSLLSYFLACRYQRIRNLNIWKQSIVISILCCFVVLGQYFILDIFNKKRILFNDETFFKVIVDFCLWPFVFLFLRNFRRKLSIR